MNQVISIARVRSMLLTGVIAVLCAGLTAGAQAQSANANGSTVVTVQKYAAVSITAGSGFGSSVGFTPPGGAVATSKASSTFTYAATTFSQTLFVRANFAGTMTATRAAAPTNQMSYTATNFQTLTATMVFQGQAANSVTTTVGSPSFILNFNIPQTTSSVGTGNPSSVNYTAASTVTVSISPN